MSDVLTDITALQLLHNTVKSYEKDCTTFYRNSNHATSKFTGRFDFKHFAKKMFDPIESNILGRLYVEMFKESGSYMHSHQKSRVGAQGFSHSFVSVPELLLNMILAYQLPQHKFVPYDKEKDDQKPNKGEKQDKSEKNGEENSGGSKKKRRNTGASKKGKNITVGPRVNLSNETSAQMLEEMIKIPLAPELKVWKTAKYVLCPSNCPKQIATFGKIIAKNTMDGLISFNALSFFMNDPVINRYMEEPATILHALYIGPLNAQTVESFAANRSDDFRQKCREVLRVALHAKHDQMTFNCSEPEFLDKNHPDRVKYREFVNTVDQLIRDLNGEHQGATGIHNGWACAAIKKFGNKRYVDKTWRDENYYDLIWTVLAQRPHLKKFVVDVLENNFKDHNAARFWRRMQPYQMNRVAIFNQNIIMENPLKPTEEFLNFPQMVQKIQVVSNDKELKDLRMLLEYKVSREETVYVGVDAEWSAYMSPSQATILQMALSDFIYIIDLESPQISQPTYLSLLSYLFETSEIMKIGFQFGEDLHQLRAAFRNCGALYRPNSVFCVGKLIMDMLEEVGNKENADEIKQEFLPFLTPEDSQVVAGNGKDANSSIDEKSDISMSNESFREEGENGQDGEGNGNQKKEDTVKQQFLNKGLSYICEKILGKPLDKTEQCSVWDRRPLRNLQLRYAAMDAYCMLMLYEKSKLIYSKIGLDVNEFLLKQSPIRISLPLLSEEQL